jgi:hypothetical protein
MYEHTVDVNTKHLRLTVLFVGRFMLTAFQFSCTNVVRRTFGRRAKEALPAMQPFALDRRSLALALDALGDDIEPSAPPSR